MDPALKAEKSYLVKLKLREKEIKAATEAKNSLLKFTMYTNPKYEANWHHRVICAYLDAFAEGRIRRLMIFLPPRHGKSELVSRRLAPYMLGRNPDEQIVLASYASSLASSMNMSAQSIMDTEEYKSVFPDSPLLQKGMQFTGRIPKRTADFFEIADEKRFGYMKTVGVGGGLTGFGFTKGIIDDPFKNREEADSETTREAVYNWYTSTFLTRQNNDFAGICLLQTRWHEDDLAGRLLDLAARDPEADQWTVLTLPAMSGEEPLNHNDKRGPGEALWPDKYPIEFLNKQRKAGSRDWAALYQQSPFSEGGTIVNREWWGYYRELPKFLDEWLISVDATFKAMDTSDYVSMQVWARKGANKYLVDQIRRKMTFTETVTSLVQLSNQYPNAWLKLIEDKANGPAIIDILKKKISGLVPVEPQGSKEARAQAVAPQIESGNVYLLHPDHADWVNDFIDEWSKFPYGKHDDQVDACSQALFRLQKNEGGGISALSQW